MNKGRLEAFSDGVLAIIITIMVLEMKAPVGSKLAALATVVPAFISYILSFAYLGIYWNNHHHLLQVTENVTGGVLWANLHLLFWLSLIPFSTRWMGENHFAPWPVAIYGIVLLFAGIAYFMLARALVAQHSEESVLAAAVGKDRKGVTSVVLYGFAVPMAFVSPIVACGLYVVVAVIWLVPDRRIESRLITLLLVSVNVMAPGLAETKEPPAYKLLRAEEDYSYLKDGGSRSYAEDIFDDIKYIPINQQGDIYLTLGGELRLRVEDFSNRQWEADGDDRFYSQRISLHSNLKIGENVRVFGELYHGYTSHEEEFTEYDELDWHQGFVELEFPLQLTQHLSLRLGRQEMTFGAARLVGLREGPNIRRTFDAVRVIYKASDNSLQTFYGREVRPEFRVFDNDYVLFDNDASNPELWGLYVQFKIGGDVGKTELYYLGFQSDRSGFNDVVGEETRHTIGLRRFGTLGQRWYYNTELIYQFGEIAGQNIRAYNIETDWHYKFIHTRWQPSIGLKLELTSGDNRAGDREINSFNPMFVNPAYYSLSKAITPVNLISIHPSLTLHPTGKLHVYVEWAMFWRESRNDGLYRPPRFLARDGNSTRKKKIGDQLGMKVEYEWSRHLSFDLDVSYFIAGEFLEATGEAENILHIASTLSFKF